MTFETGDYHDNLQAFAICVTSLRTEAPEKVLSMLAELRLAIVKSGEIKSTTWLLPEIDRAIDAAHMRCRAQYLERPAPSPMSTGIRRTPPRPAQKLDARLIHWAAIISLALTLVRVLSVEISHLPGFDGEPVIVERFDAGSVAVAEPAQALHHAPQCP